MVPRLHKKISVILDQGIFNKLKAAVFTANRCEDPRYQIKYGCGIKPSKIVYFGRSNYLVNKRNQQIKTR